MGNRTECSLLELVERLDCNVDAILEEHEILKRVPFSSERKRMTTIVGPSARYLHSSISFLKSVTACYDPHFCPVDSHVRAHSRLE